MFRSAAYDTVKTGAFSKDEKRVWKAYRSLLEFERSAAAEHSRKVWESLCKDLVKRGRPVANPQMFLLMAGETFRRDMLGLSGDLLLAIVKEKQVAVKYRVRALSRLSRVMESERAFGAVRSLAAAFRLMLQVPHLEREVDLVSSWLNNAVWITSNTYKGVLREIVLRIFLDLTRSPIPAVETCAWHNHAAVMAREEYVGEVHTVLRSMTEALLSARSSRLTRDRTETAVAELACYTNAAQFVGLKLRRKSAAKELLQRALKVAKSQGPHLHYRMNGLMRFLSSLEVPPDEPRPEDPNLLTWRRPLRNARIMPALTGETPATPPGPVRVAGVMVESIPVTTAQYEEKGVRKPKPKPPQCKRMDEQPISGISYMDAYHYCRVRAILERCGYRMPRRSEVDAIVRRRNGFLFRDPDLVFPPNLIKPCLQIAATMLPGFRDDPQDGMCFPRSQTWYEWVEPDARGEAPWLWGPNPKPNGSKFELTWLRERDLPAHLRPGEPTSTVTFRMVKTA